MAKIDLEPFQGRSVKILAMREAIDNSERRSILAKYPQRGFLVKTMSIKEYLNETKTEIAHVSWPTRKQAIAYTVLVIVISFITAFYLGAIDYVFSLILGKII